MITTLRIFYVYLRDALCTGPVSVPETPCPALRDLPAMRRTWEDEAKANDRGDTRGVGRARKTRKAILHHALETGRRASA